MTGANSVGQGRGATNDTNVEAMSDADGSSRRGSRSSESHTSSDITAPGAIAATSDHRNHTSVHDILS